MMKEITDYISTPDFRYFFEKHRSAINYILRTIIVYTFNIFSMFVSAAKNPKYDQLQTTFITPLTNLIIP